MANRIAKPIGSGQFAEQIAGHEQHIDVFAVAIAGDALDAAAQIVRAINAPEAIAQMPVGGVQDAHMKLIFSHRRAGSPPQLSSIQRMTR